jgi:hypothetical protein
LLLLEITPRQLEHRPWCLPTCVAAREVCNHLNQLVKSPLISRVRSLNLRTRIRLKEIKAFVATSTTWTYASLSGELNHGINQCLTCVLMICIAILIFVVILGFSPDLLARALSPTSRWWNRLYTTPRTLVICSIYFSMCSF